MQSTKNGEEYKVSAVPASMVSLHVEHHLAPVAGSNFRLNIKQRAGSERE